MTYPVSDERVEDLNANEVRVVVFILEENDNTSKFKGSDRPMVAVIPNTGNFGYPLTKVKHVDSDAGVNAEVRYKLLNEPSRIFGIGEVTGTIRALISVGIEQRVYGSDRQGADDGRRSIANVSVYVLDESKQMPLVVSEKPIEVEQQLEGLTASLSDVMQIDVKIRLLEPHD